MHETADAAVAPLSSQSDGMFKFELLRKQQHIYHKLYMLFTLSCTLATRASKSFRHLQSE